MNNNETNNSINQFFNTFVLCASARKMTFQLNGVNKIHLLEVETGVVLTIPVTHSDIPVNKHLKRRGVLTDYEISK